MPGILVATGFIRIDADTSPAMKAVKGLGAIASSALSTSILPVTAAVAAGVGSLAATMSAAGAAGGAFAAAVVPQFQAIAEATKDSEKSQDAQTKADLAQARAKAIAREQGIKYGYAVKLTSKMSADARAKAQEYNRALSQSKTAANSAKAAQDAYNQNLKDMTPATRDTAKAFIGLKADFKSWSDSMSGTTMPIFTMGIEKLRALLPRLTPFVRIGAREIKQFVASFGEGQAGKVFADFGRNLQGNAGSALGNLLTSIKNITVGVVGMINAFMPMQSQMSGGLVELTQRFADFGAGLGKSRGFATFMDSASGAVPALQAVAVAIGDVVSAAGPMSGFGLLMLQVFAQIVAAIPTPVLRLLVPAILAVNAGMKLYRIYQAAAAAATWLFSTSVTASTGIVYASRASLIAHRIMLLASAAATVATTAATWLWTAATTAASLAMTVLRGVLLGLRYALVLVRLAAAATALGFRLLAIAIIGNPIALVITLLVALGVAFFIAWKKSETFRNIVMAGLNGVKIGALAVAGFFSGPFVAFFIGAYNMLNRFVFRPIGSFFTVGLPRAASIGRNLTVGWVLGLRDGMVGAYRGMQARVFNPIGTFFTKTIPGWGRSLRDRVLSYFTQMRDGIGSIWSGIQNKTKAPINWVLSHVWNRGIVSVWEKITNWIGLDNRLKPVKLLAQGGTVGREPVGVFNRPTAIVGEGNPAYPEYVIPTDPKYATRARGLWQAAGAHFMESGGILGTIGGAVSSAVSKVTSFSKSALGFLDDPLGSAKKLLTGPLKNITRSIGGSPWASMVARVPRMAVDGLIKAVKSIGSDLLGAVGLGSSGGSGGSGVERWRGIVQMALRQVGQPAAYSDITLRRMNQESGGNPTIVNKWDSNWQAGHPSVGLMQVIGPTFRSYAGRYRNTGPFLYGVSTNPMANIYSSMKYALSAYGSLPRAYNRPGGYRNGTAGTAGGVHLFGEAGPELGFSPSGWRVLNARQTAGVMGGGSTVVHLTVENHGVIGSRQETEDWMVETLDQLRRKNRLPRALGGTA